MKINVIFLVGTIVFISQWSKAQKNEFWFVPGTGLSISTGVPKSLTTDTTAYHLANLRFQEEVSKRGELDLDSMRIFGNRAIQEGKTARYPLLRLRSAQAAQCRKLSSHKPSTIQQFTDRFYH